jgi:hypothetical protein
MKMSPIPPLLGALLVSDMPLAQKNNISPIRCLFKQHD